METAFLLLASVCISVIASVAIVRLLERRKKNGYHKKEEESGGEIVKIEKLANRIVERERRLNGTTL